MRELKDQNGQDIGWPTRDGRTVLINGQRIAVKSYMVEIAIPAQATPQSNYNFNIQGFLLDAFYWGIEFYARETMPISPISKNPVVTTAQLGYMFLNLYDNNSFVFWSLKPCRTMNTINDIATKNGRNYPEGLNGTRVNWQNSQVIFSDPTQIPANTALSISIELLFTLNANPQIDGLGTKNPLNPTAQL